MDEVPGGAIHSRLVCGMNVLAWAASPLFPGRYEFEFDDTFGAKAHRNDTVQPLAGGGHEDPRTTRESCLDFRAMHDLRKVRRADLFFAFRDQHQVDRHLSARATDGVERGEHGCLGSLLVNGAAANDSLS